MGPVAVRVAPRPGVGGGAVVPAEDVEVARADGVPRKFLSYEAASICRQFGMQLSICQDARQGRRHRIDRRLDFNAGTKLRDFR